jgi:hypothetical protein
VYSFFVKQNKNFLPIMALTLNVKGYLKIVFHKEDFFINHYPHSYTLFQHPTCVQYFFVDNKVILVVNGL